MPRKKVEVQTEEKHAGGRPTKYDPKYCKEMIDYFQDKSNFFPTLAGFASSIEMHKETLLNWAEKHVEFFDALKRIKDMQEHNLVGGALGGQYNPTFSIFFAKNNLGYKDKQETEHTGKDGGAIVVISAGDNPYNTDV